MQTKETVIIILLSVFLGLTFSINNKITALVQIASEIRDSNNCIVWPEDLACKNN